MTNEHPHPTGFASCEREHGVDGRGVPQGGQIQRIYNMNKPPKVKKMALLASSYSPNVYDGAIGEYRGILNYWGIKDSGIVTAKIDEQKTEATRARILELVGRLSA